MSQTAPVLTSEKQKYCLEQLTRSLLGGYNLQGPIHYHLLMVYISNDFPKITVYAVTAVQTYLIPKIVNIYIVSLIVPAIINAIVMTLVHTLIDTTYHPRKNWKEIGKLMMVLIPQTLGTASAIHYHGGILDLIVFIFLFPRDQNVELGFTDSEQYSRSHYAILHLKVMLILTHVDFLNVANAIRIVYYFTPICLFIGLFGQFSLYFEYLLEQINYFLGTTPCASKPRTTKSFLVNIATAFILAGASYSEKKALPIILAGVIANIRSVNILGSEVNEPNQLFHSSNVGRKQIIWDILQLMLNSIAIIICALVAEGSYNGVIYAAIALTVIHAATPSDYIQYSEMVLCIVQSAAIAMLAYSFSGIFGYRFVYSLAIFRLFNLTHFNLFELMLEQVIAIILSNTLSNSLPDYLLFGFVVQAAVRFLIKFGLRAKVFVLSHYAMYTQKKQKVQTASTISGTQIALFPITLVVLVISAIFDTPYMPILGLPIYSFTSVRPLRNWPRLSKQVSGTAEASIYNAFLSQSFSSLLRKHIIGSHFILRIGKYLGILQIVEQTNSYAVIQLKGLESQETTSCHGVEARELDRMVEERDWKSAVSLIRQFSVNSYEENQIILTGIIEASEFVEGFKMVFMKALCYYAEEKLDESYTASIKRLAREFSGSESFFPTTFSASIKLDTKFNKKDVKLAKQPSSKIVIKPQDDDIMGMLDSFTTNIIPEKQSELGGTTLFESLKKALLLMYQISLEDLNFNLGRLNQKQIFEVFNSDKYLQQKRQFQDVEPIFSTIITLALRKALKISVETYSIEGAIDIGDKELIEEIQSSDVYIGVGSDQGWAKALEKKSQLWSLGYEASKNKLSVFRQSYSEQKCQLLSLNSEIVRGIEANLQMELLFVTNNDDERYSIQTHELFFRNMIIEGSELPLGYAPFYSGPVVISLR